MKIGSLFSGIGGLELGLEWSGLGDVIWQAEQDKYCLQILEKHWPDVKRYQDVKEIDSRTERPDLICGGFPCQDVSAAGKGAGLSGARSGLWYEFLRIVKDLSPEWVVVENVASGAKRWVDSVRGDLELEGYATFPVPLSAADCGAWHLRRRIFIVAYLNSERRWLQQKPRREETSDTHNDGTKRHVAYTNEKRRPGGAWAGSKQPRREKPTDHDWWAVEPNVERVVHGIPNRVDRIKGLGNAVVPQCAQVVGEFIKLLINDGVKG